MRKRTSLPAPAAAAVLASTLALACSALLFQACITDFSEEYKLKRWSQADLPKPPVKKPEPPRENSVSKCWNSIDDDGDGLIDCKDDECKAIMVKCNPRDSTPEKPDLIENSLDRCSNGIDDDLNGFADCKDDNCKALKYCDTTVHPPAPKDVEDTPQECLDGIDNDQDGAKDCDDSACKLLLVCKMAPPASAEDDYDECQDQRDNDLDGKIDCQDLGCSEAWSFCSTDGGSHPDIDWFVKTREVHTLPGTVEAEYFVDPQLALDSGWSFYESDAKVNTGGTNGLVAGCRDNEVRIHGVEVTASGDREPRAAERYTGAKCPTDASITYLRYGEQLSYAVVVEKPIAKFRVKARIASGKFAEDPMRNPPYLFSINFYNPRDKMLIKAALNYHVLNTGGWHNWGTFLPQRWVNGTAYTGDCTKVMNGYDALKTSDCWVGQLPEETLTLTKGQWIMELVSQEGSYNVNYFEFQEISP